MKNKHSRLKFEWYNSYLGDMQMASIELDIIKQRSEKLTLLERRELIEYLTAGLEDQTDRQPQDMPDNDLDNLIDEEANAVS
jgi:hypothetical protein